MKLLSINNIDGFVSIRNGFKTAISDQSSDYEHQDQQPQQTQRNGPRGSGQ